MKWILLTTLLFVMPFVSRASDKLLTAGELADYCRHIDREGLPKDAHGAYCYGYIQGYLEGSVGNSMVDKGGVEYTIMPADNVTTEQVIHIFCKYMTEHPEYGHKGALVAVNKVLLHYNLVTLKAKQNNTSANVQ
jgi:Ssp1 endopeptidase immunity protein Rap1a